MRVLFVTDLHGCKWKYERLLKAAKKFRATIVINGGDMLPKEGDLFTQDKFITTLIITLRDSTLLEFIIFATWETMTLEFSMSYLRRLVISIPL